MPLVIHKIGGAEGDRPPPTYNFGVAIASEAQRRMQYDEAGNLKHDTYTGAHPEFSLTDNQPYIRLRRVILKTVRVSKTQRLA